MADASTIAKDVRRDRLIVLAAVVAVIAVAWIYVVIRAQGMSDLAAIGVATQIQIKAWTTVDLLLLFVMWTIMMVDMMLPSAVPLILNFTAEARQEPHQAGVLAPTTALVLGYVVVWTGFSVLATTRPVGAAPGGPAFAHDGEHQPGAERRPAARRGRLPVDPDAVQFVEALPAAAPFPQPALAGGHRRRLRHGAGTRRILLGLLLRLDGYPVHRRRNEPAVVGSGYSVRTVREGLALRQHRGTGQWAVDDCSWHLLPGPALTLEIVRRATGPVGAGAL